MDHMLTFNCVYKYEPNTLEISTLPILERNLLADDKGPQHWIQIVVWVMDLYRIHLLFDPKVKFLKNIFLTYNKS